MIQEVGSNTQLHGEQMFRFDQISSCSKTQLKKKQQLRFEGNMNGKSNLIFFAQIEWKLNLTKVIKSNNISKNQQLQTDRFS